MLIRPKNGQRDLFAEINPLDWLPDETSYSLASRINKLWGETRWWRTSELLFGNRRAGWQHDFPRGLQALAERTGGLLGTAREIAKERTLLKYYERFLAPDDREAIVSDLIEGRVAHLKYRLGILTSRFRAHHPLKACVQCLAEDVREYGWAYWHLEHQYPGVWWCLEHDEPLRESLVKSSGVERFQWRLPCAGILREPPAGSSSVDQTSLAGLARCTIGLFENPKVGDLIPHRLPEIYRLELERRGWATVSGRLRLKEVAQGFLEYCRQLRALPELATLPVSHEDSYTQVGRLLRPMRTGTHPLRHALLIDWLFGSADRLCEAASTESPAAHPDHPPYRVAGPVTEFEDARKKRQSILADRLKAGSSIRAAALELGIEVATAQAWAASLGFKVDRRPKKLDAIKHQKLIRALKAGADKETVAERLGVSVVTVTRILRTEAGLQEAWHRVRQARARKSARESWLKQLETHGHLGQKMVRELQPAAYAWLYRNDRPWLAAHQPSRLSSRPEGRASSVAWDERDIDLSNQVRQAALARASGVQDGKRIHLWHLYQAVPELKAKLDVLHRLPLTVAAIESAIGRPSRRRSAAGNLFE